MEDAGHVAAHGLDVEPLRARGRGGLLRRGREGLDEHDARPRGREGQTYRARARVEVEHARARRCPFPTRCSGSRRGHAHHVGQERVHALRLPAVSLHEGAERREVDRRADAIGRVVHPGEPHGLASEDLRRVAHVEVHGDADDHGNRLHQLAGRVLERRSIGPGARALHHERDEHARAIVTALPGSVEGRPRCVAHLAKVHGAQRAPARGIERRERPAGGLGRPDAVAERGHHRDEGGREHAAPRNVDDMVPAARGEQPDGSARRDDELRARAIRDDRVRRRGWRDGDDRLRCGGGERRIARDRVDDARSLPCELLVVRELDEGAAAAAVGVIAGDARGHGGGRRGP